MNKRNLKAYNNIKTALESLKKIEFCFKNILKEFDKGTPTPPSQVCAQNEIDYSRLKRLLKSLITLKNALLFPYLISTRKRLQRHISCSETARKNQMKPRLKSRLTAKRSLCITAYPTSTNLSISFPKQLTTRLTL